MTRHIIDRSGAPATREMRSAFLKLDKSRRMHPSVRKAHARATQRSDEARLRQYLRIEREAES